MNIPMRSLLLACFCPFAAAAATAPMPPAPLPIGKPDDHAPAGHARRDEIPAGRFHYPPGHEGRCAAPRLVPRPYKTFTETISLKIQS